MRSMPIASVGSDPLSLQSGQKALVCISKALSSSLPCDAVWKNWQAADICGEHNDSSVIVCNNLRLECVRVQYL